MCVLQRIRVCVDYKDLKQACPKDDSPLSKIDLLFDATAGHHMFSFVDGFSVYKHIKMTTNDAEKTAFRTPNSHWCALQRSNHESAPINGASDGSTWHRSLPHLPQDLPPLASLIPTSLILYGYRLNSSNDDYLQSSRNLTFSHCIHSSNYDDLKILSLYLNSSSDN